MITRNLIIIEAENESHCVNLHSELFCVTEKDSDYIGLPNVASCVTTRR